MKEQEAKRVLEQETPAGLKWEQPLPFYPQPPLRGATSSSSWNEAV